MEGLEHSIEDQSARLPSSTASSQLTLHVSAFIEPTIASSETAEVHNSRWKWETVAFLPTI